MLIFTDFAYHEDIRGLKDPLGLKDKNIKAILLYQDEKDNYKEVSITPVSEYLS